MAEKIDPFMEMTIEEFYSGAQIFITGGSGFVGKVLIEKLLRSCPDLDTIFVLMRPKRGTKPQKRLMDMTESPMFNLLRETNPMALNKLTAIEGDVAQLEMGVSPTDLKLMRNVSIIFHVAASVRFDDPLRYAILMNTRGTREVLEFALTLNNIKSIVHVSTSYCYPDKLEVGEKLYPPYADWKVAIKAAERFDTELLNVLGPKFSSFQPNTYTFTKSMAEYGCNDYKDRLPITIVRPSIVVNAISEPIPGWVDSFNGPIGLFIASGVGILRTMHGKSDIVSDFIPVDVVVKIIIIAAFKSGIKPQHVKEENNEIAVYNACAAATRGIPTGKIIKMAEELISHAPFNQMLWVPYGTLDESKVYHHIKFLFYHILIAVFVDSLMRLMKKQPFLLRIQRRIYAANKALYYFSINEWTFHNNKMIELDTTLPLRNVRDWQFLNQKDIDINVLFFRALMVVRRYILKEPDENLPYAKKKFWIIYYFDYLIKIVFLTSMAMWIYTKFEFGQYVCPFIC